MLNYIWAGLILASLCFALAFDIGELRNDRYANSRPLPVTLVFPSPAATNQPVKGVAVRIAPEVYAAHYRVQTGKNWADLAGEYTLDQPSELRLTTPALPQPLGDMRSFLDRDNKLLRASLTGVNPDELANARANGGEVRAQVLFPPVRFVKMNAIQKAALSFAETAVTIALGLIGVLALWLGMMKIAEASGLIAAFVVVVQPFLRLLFPQIPKNHPALGMIALNLSANMLGLGNAATPFGIKAMEELQKLNPKKDTATNPMVMLLALNTAGVQILPSATLIAIMGLGAIDLFFPILFVTALCAGIAIIVTKICERLPSGRKSDPGTLLDSTNAPEAA
jgi:spore maturation protein A